MADDKYYKIKECILNDMGRVIRMKRNETVLYNEKIFDEKIVNIDMTIHGDEYLPLPEPDSTPPYVPPEPKEKIYLWNCEAADPQCTDVTGGWDLTGTKGWQRSGGGIAQQAGTNYVDIRPSYYSGYMKSINTVGQLPIQQWLDDGYSYLAIELEDYWDSKATSTNKTNSQQVQRNFFAIWSKGVNASNATIANAFVGGQYSYDYFFRAEAPVSSAGYRQRVMRKFAVVPLKKDSPDLDILSITISSASQKSPGPRLYIKKIYVG